jgi:hypothetical protein
MDGLIPTAVRGQLARPTYQRSFMRTLSMLAAIAAVFTFVSFSAQAIPAASLKGATNSD